MSIASLYPSINPSLLLDFANSKVLDSRVTFTRTTTATYYDGVTTAVAEQNLLTYSQEFDNAAWSKTSGSVTANADNAPDGTSTADLFTPSASDARIQQSFFPTGAVQCTCSVWLRSATGSSFSTDLLFWRVSPFSSIATTTITVTTTWQRFTLTATALDATAHAFVIGGGGSLTTGENVYMWGAQAEIRSSATAYTATTSQAITNYIPVLQTAAAGQARFDHNPTTGESLGLLIEEARTNVCLQSEDFNTGWTLGSSTVSTNATIAPNGTLTADKIIPSSTGSNRGLYRTFTASGATTVSVYAKYGGYQWFYLVKPDGSNIGVSFDILNGVKGTEQSGVTGTITSVGNGWYRCTCTQTYTGTAYAQLGVASADNSTSVTVATNDVLSGTFIWGAQAETSGSSFATSYIPTVASSVTRNADAASMTGTNFSSWFNNGEGTVYSESTPTAQTSNGHVLFSLLSTAGQNFIASGQYIANSMVRSIIVDVNAVNQVLLVGSNGANNKIAAAYKANDFAGSINGSAASTDTSGTVPVVAQAYLGSLGTFGQPYTGTIKKLAYYPIRVTNAQLQALTV